ncbi:MAG: hypothetical protein HQK68_12030, partial [Desulfamplus sp.]|nr:hypothetical protein [Desulfamplus sp.]
MAITLEKQAGSPSMGIMITVSLVVHLFLFLHIDEIYRLKRDFKKPEPPIKIEVMLQEIPKPAPIAPTSPLAAVPPPVVETPSPVVEPIPVIPPPPITEDSRISQPVIPIPEPVKEKKKEIIKKVIKTKVVVEEKKKPVKKIQKIEKRVEQIPKVPPMPASVPLPHSASPTTTTTQNGVAQNRVSQKSVAQPVIKASTLVKAPIVSQSDKLLAKAYFNSMRLMIEKN